MEITDVHVFPVKSNDKLRAFVSVILDNCFMVSDIKIIQGPDGNLFLSMPSKRGKDGKFRDIAHPLNAEVRKQFEEKIIPKYQKSLEKNETPETGESPSPPKDSLPQNED